MRIYFYNKITETNIITPDKNPENLMPVPETHSKSVRVYRVTIMKVPWLASR